MTDPFNFQRQLIAMHIAQQANQRSCAEFIDPVFAKTSPKRSFSIIENDRFGLVFAKTRLK